MKQTKSLKMLKEGISQEILWEVWIDKLEED